MKILLINDNHRITGGAENYFFELKSKLNTLPNTEVYSIGFGDTAQTGDDFYVFKAARSNAAKLLWRLIPNLPLYFKLKSLIKRIDPDVVHIHNIKQYTATVLAAIKPYSVVQTVHDFSLICPTSQNIHRDLTPCVTGMQRKCFWRHRVKFSYPAYLLMSLAWLSTNLKLKKLVDAFIAPSPFLTSYLQANQFNPALYIPPFNTASDSTINDKINTTYFLYAGSLANHKGVRQLLTEFAIAHQHNPSLTLDLIGAGPLEDTLRHDIAKLNLTNNVRLLGWQSDLSSYYQRAGALIFPSIGLESFGLVVSEAMSHGRPVIGVNRGTTAWLVEDGVTGLLFDPLKKGDLAEKILKLAGNHQLAMQLGAQGRQRINQLIDNDAALSEIVDVYRSVL